MRTKFKIKGVHKFVYTDLLGNIVRKKTYENIVVAVGRYHMCKILAGLETTVGINYVALGTGSTSITDADTILEAEGARKVRGIGQQNEDTFIVSFYFGPTEGNGSWTRYATFVDGTATADTGVMFSHAVIDETKTEGQGLTITSYYTFTDETP